MERARVCGIVLAAGAGRRFGGPKALARDEAGVPWLALACAALTDGGCAEVVVVLGAEEDAARPLVPAGARVTVAADWASGLSRSVVAGLGAVGAGFAGAVVIPVDTPELPASAVARVIAAAEGRDDALVRAVYDGAPGHPVLIGAAHTEALAADLTGDRGAGAYLDRVGAQAVECGDLWSGADHDIPVTPPTPHPLS